MDDKLKDKVAELSDNADLIKARVLLLLDKYKTVKQEIDELEEWNSLSEIVSNMTKIGDVVLSTIFLVEIACKDIFDKTSGISSDKLDAAVYLIDKFIKGPWYVEIADGILIRFALQFGTSLVVTAINKLFGKNWNIDELRNVFHTVGSMREAFGEHTVYSEIEKEVVDVLKKQ